MYVHHGCRCEECCRAEHEQYLKRSKGRNRVGSKWGPEHLKTPRAERQRRHNKTRYAEYLQTGGYRARIKWQDLAKVSGMVCASCGVITDPTDTWTNEKGRKCFGRKYPTVDHIIALKNGGKDTLDNVQLLCKHCNSSKGRRDNGHKAIK